MSGRSRGKKNSRGKGRGRGRGKARPRAAPDAAADAAGPSLPEPEPEPEPEPGPAAAAAAAPLPLDCGLALRARRAAARAPRAPSVAERLTADPVFVGTAGLAGRPRPGPRAGGRKAGGAGKGGKAKRGAAPRAEAEPPPAAPAAPAAPPDGSVRTLESVQLRLETMNAQADRAYLRLARKFGQLRLRHLERRDLLIGAIPGFWGRALQNHPRLRPFLSARDRQVLAHLRRLEVEELGLARLGYRVKLHFAPNPFFRNRVLVKEYGCGPAGHVVSRATPIQWRCPEEGDGQGQAQDQAEDQGQADDPQAQGDGHHRRPSFFSWFSNHSGIEADKIVEIINEELWPNPLQFYLMGEEAPTETDTETQEGQEEPEPAGEGEPEPPELATPNPAS